MRTTVVHFHLFKNAGTTVERGLQDYFGERWASFDKPASAARISQVELETFLNTNQALQAVSSHHLRPPLVDSTLMKWLPVLFLRHPIDRIRSAYEFERTARFGIAKQHSCSVDASPGMGAVSPRTSTIHAMSELSDVRAHNDPRRGGPTDI